MASIIRRRIEKSAEATLNLGDMQFVKVRTLIDQTFEGTEEELKEADARVWAELGIDVRRGMWSTLRGLGKTTDADRKLFELCAQRVQEAMAAKKTQETSKT